MPLLPPAPLPSSSVKLEVLRLAALPDEAGAGDGAAGNKVGGASGKTEEGVEGDVGERRTAEADSTVADGEKGAIGSRRARPFRGGASREAGEVEDVNEEAAARLLLGAERCESKLARVLERSCLGVSSGGDGGFESKSDCGALEWELDVELEARVGIG